jgi:hypothetical protein
MRPARFKELFLRVTLTSTQNTTWFRRSTSTLPEFENSPHHQRTKYAQGKSGNDEFLREIVKKLQRKFAHKSARSEKTHNLSCALKNIVILMTHGAWCAQRIESDRARFSSKIRLWGICIGAQKGNFPNSSENQGQWLMIQCSAMEMAWRKKAQMTSTTAIIKKVSDNIWREAELGVRLWDPSSNYEKKTFIRRYERV